MRLGGNYLKMIALIVSVVVVAGIVAFLVSPNFYMGHKVRSTASSGGREVVVFCAGSLYIPLQKVKELFESQHPGVNVIIEPSGSVVAVRKVTDLGRRADVLALADYRLVPKYMMPKYADWAIGFATNRLVLVYTNKSRYADMVNSSNWISVLRMPDVKYGFSNPNDDPCGYRALTLVGLASLKYGDQVLKDLILSKTNIKAESINGTLHIYVPSDLEVNSSNLIIRSKSVDLISLLEAGTLDYAFEYRSVAVQHHLRYVELPPQLNLGDPNFSNFYSKVVIHLLYGTDKEREVAGAPIVYGITIPSTAEDIRDALDFINLTLGPQGREIFEGFGQSFLSNPIYVGNVPKALMRVSHG